MNSFKRRIKYYIIGLLMGLMFTYILFGNRGCSWLPENRVKNMIAEKEIIVGDSVKYLMSCTGVTHNDVYRLLNEDGDVNFKKSRTDEYPKVYWFTGEKEEQDLNIQYALFDSVAEVVGFNWKGGPECSTQISNFNKSVVNLPEVEIVEIIESKEMRILEEAECQMKCYNLSKDDVLNFHKSALNDPERSEPRLKPNPFYILIGEIKNEAFEITYVIGESRTRISNILSLNMDCDCE